MNAVHIYALVFITGTPGSLPLHPNPSPGR
jgi:hypothetical protein